MKKFENLKNLDKSIVLIIGGNSGIGKGVAELFLKKDDSFVVITGRNYQKGIEVQNELSEISDRIEFVQLDVKQSDNVKEVVKYVTEKYGKLDICCNCAGIEHRFASMIELSEEEFDEIISVNLKGVWLCMKYQIKQMMRQKQGGAIINISSVSGQKSTPNGAVYSSSKHGVEGLTKTAANEYARFGIRINNVTPGLVKTPMAHRVLGISEDSTDELCNKYIPSGRMASPEEVANAVYWLSSQDASYIIGHSLIVDGGLSLGR
ncbi:SDR family NAD(P)-dependent oxidoreductase [Peribacillus simplex]|uniref:SDR family NAD(P)-dependent oxidoreductase n=1 Tax=Peribacillus simplex TaxID=1478 RepID=UPI003D2A9C4A